MLRRHRRSGASLVVTGAVALLLCGAAEAQMRGGQVTLGGDGLRAAADPRRGVL